MMMNDRSDKNPCEEDEAAGKKEEEKVSEKEMNQEEFTTVEEEDMTMNPLLHLVNEICSSILKCLGCHHFFSTKHCAIHQDHDKDSSTSSTTHDSDSDSDSNQNEGRELVEAAKISTRWRRRKRQPPPPLDDGGNPQTNSNPLSS